jgi:drug/metabolite transporter (DMT)-like permease
LVSIAFVILFRDVVGPWPQPDDAAALGLWVAIAAVLTLPMLALTIWPATVLSPGRVGILLMGEIVVGVTSAALFSGQPFGLRELVGTLLILAAGVVEVLPAPPKVRAAPSE